MATKVFISWSGDLSQRLGEELRKWLPSVLQFVTPYFTPKDIEKGTRWDSDIAAELESSDIGIICITKDNTEAPWLLFEAGAISKTVDESKVCPLLFDLETTDLKGPLTVFQHTKFQHDDFKTLVTTVNNAGGEAKLSESVLNNVFEKWWPDLDERVQKVLTDHQDESPQDARTERDILEEILELARLASRKKVDVPPSYEEITNALMPYVAQQNDKNPTLGPLGTAAQQLARGPGPVKLNMLKLGTALRRSVAP